MKAFSRSILFVLLFFFLCQAGWAQKDKRFKRFGKWMINDPISLAKDMNSNTLLNIGITTFVIGSLTPLDESNSRLLQREYRNSDFLSFTNKFGSKNIAFPASALLFGGTLFTKNTKLQDAAFTSLQSVIFTSLTVGAGKFLFARSRPGDDDGAYDFDFVNPGETSFPSGHASTAFAFITPWVLYYPNAFTYSLLAIPAGTAIARIAKGRHWFSDVTAGAAIGFAMSYYLSKKHIGELDKNIHLAPSISQGHTSLAISIKL